MLQDATETLGITREEMYEQLHSGKAKYSSIFNYPTVTWADMGAIHELVDRVDFASAMLKSFYHHMLDARYSKIIEEPYRSLMGRS